MTEYHKVQSIFKRDKANKKALIIGDWTEPEFAYLADCHWILTEKVDGMNIRVIIKDDGFTFGGRTDNAAIPAPLVARLNEIFNPLAELLKEKFGGNSETVLYGEGYGSKIQAVGNCYRADQDFVLFDVKIGGWWLRRGDVEQIARDLGLDVVPVLGIGTLHDAVNMCKEGFKSQWGDFEAEGIVARPLVELCKRNGGRIITKVKCRDFPR